MVVITYDITDEKRLRKVAKLLEQNGLRVQRSVFEVEKKIAKKLFEELSEIVEESDRLFLIPFNKKEDIEGVSSLERIF